MCSPTITYHSPSAPTGFPETGPLVLGLLVLQHVHTYSPVVDGSSGVLAALHFDHEQREEQEEDGHSEADAIDGPVAHQHVTVNMSGHTGQRRGHALFTEAWNLTTGTQVILPGASEWSKAHKRELTCVPPTHTLQRMSTFY